MKTSILASILLITLAACGPETGDSRVAGTKEGTLAQGEATTLTVKDDSGDVTIKGTDADQVQVKVTVTTKIVSEEGDEKALSAANADPKADGTNVTVDTTWDLPDLYGSDVAISANKDLTLVVTDGSGDLEISNWSGMVKITDASGDIILNNVGAYEIVSDSSGDVIIDGVVQEEEDED